MAKGDHRVHSRRSPRRDVASHGPHNEQSESRRPRTCPHRSAARRKAGWIKGVSAPARRRSLNRVRSEPASCRFRQATRHTWLVRGAARPRLLLLPTETDGRRRRESYAWLEPIQSGAPKRRRRFGFEFGPFAKDPVSFPAHPCPARPLDYREEPM
jgi:hypothetical protein